MLFDTTHLLIMLALWAVSTIAMFIKDWKTMTFSKFGNSIPFTIMFSYLSCKETHESSVRGRNCNNPFN